MRAGFWFGVMLCAAGVWLAGCSRGAAPATAGGKTGPVVELSEAGFAGAITNGVVLVDFWAPWCGPCRTQGPIVDVVAGQVEGRAVVAKLNVDEAPTVSRSYNISGIPTLIVFRDGKPVKQFTGVTKAETLVSAITDALAL